MRVVVLGAGFGGLELASQLSERFGDGVEVVVIDRTDSFVFGFSKLDVMFGRTVQDRVHHLYADVAKPGVKIVQAEITAIDPTAKTVTTDAGTFEADYLVVALGADLEPAATPGLLEHGYEFYTEEAAFELREVLATFDGGRVIVGVTSTPFKCPPAPSETVMLMHDFLTDKGVRDRSEIDLVMPMPVPIPPSPEASQVLLASFAERGITFHGPKQIAELAPNVARLDDGTEMPFDLFLGVPKHKAPQVVVDSGLTVDGWIPVDFQTLETSFDGVYAVGDVNSVGTPKAGVFAESQAIAAADAIAARIEAGDGGRVFDGKGQCYFELGSAGVAIVQVTFTPGQAPVGSMIMPSMENVAEKVEFGRSRVKRWFGRDWTPTP